MEQVEERTPEWMSGWPRGKGLWAQSLCWDSHFLKQSFCTQSLGDPSTEFLETNKNALISSHITEQTKGDSRYQTHGLCHISNLLWLWTLALFSGNDASRGLILLTQPMSFRIHAHALISPSVSLVNISSAEKNQHSSLVIKQNKTNKTLACLLVPYPILY